jgi:uncharacterized membrane protein
MSTGSECRTGTRDQPKGPIGHLWAIGYDDMARADQVREVITGLGWDRPYLILEDIAAVVRHPDGTFALGREPVRAVAQVTGLTIVGFLAGLVTATPIAGAAIGAVLGGVNAAVAAAVRIDAGFIRDAERLMKPGTSALFVLDDGGDMDVILHHIRGLGGTILKTNVDPARARLIQSTLAAVTATRSGEPDESSDA